MTGPRLPVPVRTIARLAAAAALVLPLAGAVTALVSTPEPVGAAPYASSALFTPLANNVAQSFRVPWGVTQLSIDAKGGQGGDGGGSAGVNGGTGGKAAEVIDLVGVTPGDVIVINVGRAGGSANTFGGSAGGADGTGVSPGGNGGSGDGPPTGNGGGGGAGTKVGPAGDLYLVAGGGGGGGGGGGIVGYHGGPGGTAGDSPGGGTGGTGPGAGSGSGTKPCTSSFGGHGGIANDFTDAGGGGGGGGGFGGFETTDRCGGWGGSAGGYGAGGGGGGGAGGSYVDESTSQGSQIFTSTTGGDGSVLITWAQPSSRTSVSSTGATSVGGSRTFTATVSPPFGITTPTPTGTVNFYRGSTLLGGASLVNGKATLTTGALTAGDDTVRAAYQGDDVYAPSQAFTSVTLSPGTPLVAAGTTPDPTSGSVDMWAAVSRASGADASAPAPTGSVHFVDTTYGIDIDSGTYPLDGNGEVHVPNAFSNDMYVYTLEAIYSGDGNYASVTTTFSVHIVDETSVSLSSGVNPSKVGQRVPLTATVVDYGRAPTGTVTFLDGATVVGTAALVANPTVAGSQATLGAMLGAGSHSITARYDGDDIHFGSVSSAITQQVDEAAPPVADAGTDIKARKGATVTVDGTGSTDPQGEPLTYRWAQISGLPATIADSRTGRTTVALPTRATTVKLRLTVTNAAGLTSTSDVTITVSPK